MAKRETINVAPTARTVLRLGTEAGVVTNLTHTIAALAVEYGLGDVAIDRLSLTLNLDEHSIASGVTLP